jgi:RNA polymerase sigma-19 factor, ECF subfamily
LRNVAQGESPIDEAALIQRLRDGSGSETAFAALFRAHYAELVQYADGILRDGAAAEDMVQDVMLALWRRREQLAVETSVRAYLLRAVRNRALNAIRHNKVAGRIALESARPNTTPADDGNLVEQEIHAAFRSAVDSLPDRCREVFELSRVHGLTYNEIASTLELSIKTVEAHMGKALRMIRARLAPWLPNEPSFE